MASVTETPRSANCARSRRARCAVAYAFGLRPVAAWKRRWKWLVLRPAAAARVARVGAASALSVAHSMRRQAATIQAAWGRGPAWSGWQRRQGRKPAAAAAVPLGKKIMLRASAARARQEGRQ